ncbi:phospholipase D family nuclease [Citrobacter braakii]|uniref:phospholipase D family nuclease n=1 Tax=Citrobacter braakii TaxID=57706 RepID=UPI00403A7182
MSRITSLLAALVLSSAPVLAADITVGFSPSGNALKTVLGAINGARTSIDLAAYSFTSSEIADALVNAAARGVHVRIVADEKDNAHSKGSKVSVMQENHIPIRLDGHYAIMHNKYMVIDGTSVETGSFNYTASADKRNAENAIFIQGEPQLATIYGQEFDRLWQESAPVSGTPTSSSPGYSYHHKTSTSRTLVRLLKGVL